MIIVKVYLQLSSPGNNHIRTHLFISAFLYRSSGIIEIKLELYFFHAYLHASILEKTTLLRNQQEEKWAAQTI
jgi:hypothetical protein